MSSKVPEFVELTLPNGLHIILTEKDITQAWETNVPGEVLLRVIEHEDQYIRVLYPWAKIKELLPAANHKKQPSKKAGPPLQPRCKKALTHVSGA